MKPNFTVFFSNYLEQLAENLLASLFATSDPFTPRHVVIPSEAVKNFLLFFFAKHPFCQAAAFIRFYSLPKFLKEVSGDLFLKPIELSLAIQWALEQKQASKSDPAFCDALSRIFHRYREYGKTARAILGKYRGVAARSLERTENQCVLCANHRSSKHSFFWISPSLSRGHLYGQPFLSPLSVRDVLGRLPFF